MNLMYDLASCNSAEARRQYESRFLNKTLPDKKTFNKLDERLRETGTFKKRESDGERLLHLRTFNCKEWILKH